jgi:hypothetical protein
MTTLNVEPVESVGWIEIRNAPFCWSRLPTWLPVTPKYHHHAIASAPAFGIITTG